MKVRKIDIIFVIIVVAVVIGLSIAPPQTTPKFPKNDIHNALTDEKSCVECHSVGKIKPLPEKHPKKDRCFFCHKKK